MDKLTLKTLLLSFASQILTSLISWTLQLSALTRSSEVVIIIARTKIAEKANNIVRMIASTEVCGTSVHQIRFFGVQNIQ